MKHNYANEIARWFTQASDGFSDADELKKIKTFKKRNI